jgi:NAD(P)-dependent dehydrogenase (short-subunit alcohol dehydrogenase family)
MNIVITGASQGVGYYTALALSKKGGNRVFALSRNAEGLKKLLSEAGQDSGLTILVCDITDEQSVAETVQRIASNVSGIDVLINNAGRLINKSFSALAISDWKEVFDVNVFGTVRITKALLTLLSKGSISKEAGIRAHIVNISSMGGVQGSMKFSGLSAYSSSKGAMITFSDCLAVELQPQGISVNSIALGSVETAMFKSAFPNMKASANPAEIAEWISDFALKGFEFFNGKVIPLSNSTP